jgi:predicted RNase H-like HicB family nuclease
MDFYITVNKNEYGYSSSCPTLKGCHSQGDTEEEAISNIKIAIKEYLQTFQELNNDDNMKLIKVEVNI